MNKNKLREYLKVGFIYIKSILRATWFSTIDILQLIVYAFLLNALIFYYNQTAFIPIQLDAFLGLVEALAKNWELFWFIFVIWRIIKELKEGEFYK